MMIFPPTYFYFLINHHDDSTTYTYRNNNNNNTRTITQFIYISDELIWSATPQPPETSACIVFGSCFVPIHYFRLQGAGALVAYDDSRSKVYDSHRDGGDYSDYAISELGLPEDGVNAVSEKRSGSTLELNDSGVFIVDQEAGNVVTWKIDAPTLETESPTISPTKVSVREECCFVLTCFFPYL